MTLTPDILKRCEDAIPALGNVYADLENNHSSMLREVKLQARAALWYFPELIQAAKLLDEAMRELAKGRYSSMEITKDALGMAQDKKALMLAIKAIGELALGRLAAIESGDCPPIGRELFDQIAGICEKAMGA